MSKQWGHRSRPATRAWLHRGVSSNGTIGGHREGPGRTLFPAECPPDTACHGKVRCGAERPPSEKGQSVLRLCSCRDRAGTLLSHTTTRRTEQRKRLSADAQQQGRAPRRTPGEPHPPSFFLDHSGATSEFGETGSWNVWAVGPARRFGNKRGVPQSLLTTTLPTCRARSETSRKPTPGTRGVEGRVTAARFGDPSVPSLPGGDLPSTLGFSQKGQAAGAPMLPFHFIPPS